MQSFKDWFEENYEEEYPKGNIDGKWFDDHGLQMMVECKCCCMSMALPSAMIDANGHIYCHDCGGVE